MTACLALLAAVTSVAGCGDRPVLLRLGCDPARGVLVNFTPGVRPCDPPDPAWPTVVFVHGVNPAPWVVHFEMADRLAEALGRRGGPALNVLGWDWNAATSDSLSHRANDERAVRLGLALAAELRRIGAVPPRLHLIGHSSGGIVATSAARDLAAGCGRPVAQLTLLDPATCYHPIIYDRLAAGSCAVRVENYWAPGPSGFGRAVGHAGVRNIRVDGPTPFLGLVDPLRSSHLAVVRWYIGTAEDPSSPLGFNASLLLGDGGH